MLSEEGGLPAPSQVQNPLITGVQGLLTLSVGFEVGVGLPSGNLVTKAGEWP